MGKYNVTYACGHETKVDLFGVEKERQRRIASMQRQNCPECRAKAAVEADKASGLPTLIGAEKQVAWASDIRRERLPEMKAAAEKAQASIDKVKAGMADSDKMAEVMAKTGWTREEMDRRFEVETKPLLGKIACYEAAKTQTSASWWIDNR